MKMKASPLDASVLIPLAREAGRRAVVKSLYEGLTVYGSVDAVIVGYDFSTHPMTQNLAIGAKLEDHPKSNY